MTARLVELLRRNRVICSTLLGRNSPVVMGTSVTVLTLDSVLRRGLQVFSCTSGKRAIYCSREVGGGRNKRVAYRDPLTEKPTEGYLSALKILKEREKNHEQANLSDRHC